MASSSGGGVGIEESGIWGFPCWGDPSFSTGNRWKSYGFWFCSRRPGVTELMLPFPRSLFRGEDARLLSDQITNGDVSYRRILLPANTP